MRILIADDDPTSRRMLAANLINWGHEVVVTANGAEAWDVLKLEEAPSLAILDVMMPEMDGLEICKQVRQAPSALPPYIILLTAMGDKEDIVRGIESGANDYLTKPFHRDELRVRVNAAVQMVELQRALTERVKELETAIEEVKFLRGILPICSYCKSIRDDQNHWQKVESYITQRTDAQLSHSICPSCYESVVKTELDKFKSRK